MSEIIRSHRGSRHWWRHVKSEWHKSSSLFSFRQWVRSTVRVGIVKEKGGSRLQNNNRKTETWEMNLNTNYTPWFLFGCYVIGKLRGTETWTQSSLDHDVTGKHLMKVTSLSYTSDNHQLRVLSHRLYPILKEEEEEEDDEEEKDEKKKMIMMKRRGNYAYKCNILKLCTLP